MNISKRDFIVILICIGIFIAFLITGALLIGNKEKNSEMVLMWEPIEYLQVDFVQPKSSDTSITFSTESQFSTSVDFAANDSSSVTSNYSAESNSSNTVTATGANAELFNYCSKYFNVHYGDCKLSPILPMAIANVETPGRADFKVTWSALFPSRIVPVSEMGTFNVTSVISNPDYFKALSAEYSTRDRGCLQMSPTYGTGNSSLNAMMSGTEKDKLESVDTSSYSSWVKGASSSAGDRFYLPDVLLRMTAAMQLQCDNMSKNNYAPNNDFQLIAMCAMGHQSSGVWHYSNHEKKIGCWRSGAKAYEWATLVGSQDVVDALVSYADSSNDTYIDSKTAKLILSKVCSYNPSDYATKDLVCYYPVKALYSYIKLCKLYTK